VNRDQVAQAYFERKKKKKFDKLLHLKFPRTSLSFFFFLGKRIKKNFYLIFSFHFLAGPTIYISILCKHYEYLCSRLWETLSRSTSNKRLALYPRRHWIAQTHYVVTNFVRRRISRRVGLVRVHRDTECVAGRIGYWNYAKHVSLMRRAAAVAAVATAISFYSLNQNFC